MKFKNIIYLFELISHLFKQRIKKIDKKIPSNRYTTW